MSQFIIKMLETRRGSEDGFAVRRFDAGQVLEVGKDIRDTLARSFIVNGWAREQEGAL